MYNINRRKFLGLISCSCCSIILPSCSTVPITERKQLSIISDARINKQAAAAYENFRNKTKLITSGSQLKEVIDIGKRIEDSVSAFFNKEGNGASRDRRGPESQARIDGIQKKIKLGQKTFFTNSIHYADINELRTGFLASGARSGGGLIKTIDGEKGR